MAALGVVDPSAAGRNRLVAPRIASLSQALHEVVARQSEWSRGADHAAALRLLSTRKRIHWAWRLRVRRAVRLPHAGLAIGGPCQIDARAALTVLVGGDLALRFHRLHAPVHDRRLHLDLTAVGLAD